jgi:hypothetical protein
LPDGVLDGRLVVSFELPEAAPLDEPLEDEPPAALREGVDGCADDGDEGVALRLALEPVPAFWSRLQPASARAAAAARIIRTFMGNLLCRLVPGAEQAPGPCC